MVQIAFYISSCEISLFLPEAHDIPMVAEQHGALQAGTKYDGNASSK